MPKDLKKLSKKELESEIIHLINDNPNKEKLKKVKILAMSRNIKIGALKKRYCKNCLSIFNSKNSEIRIKKPLKIINCKQCGYKTRYNLNSKKQT